MHPQRHVADAAKLPAPTFTRLARAIGFDSYDQLRDVCREDVLHTQTVLADRARALVEEPMDDSGAASLVARHAVAAIRNTQALVDLIDQEALTKASQILARASKVVLIGELSARGIVDYASYVANMSLTGWKVLGRAGESLASDIADLKPGDACIVLSISPYSTRAIETAEHVAKCGIPVIAVTDNALSPLAALADFSFFIGSESPQFFPSHVASTAFFETLVGMVIRERGEEAQKYIAAVERQKHKMNEYWPVGQ